MSEPQPGKNISDRVSVLLTTDRLLIMPLTTVHLRDLVTVAGSRFIADTTISVPHPMTTDLAEEWLTEIALETESGLAFHFAITLKLKSEEMIGYIAIKAINLEHKEGELSFWLAPHFNGRGYITEAAQAVVEFGFETIQLNRICAYHMVRNPASAGVLRKLGFTQEGRLRERVQKWQRFEDVLLWSRLRHD